MTPEDCCLIWKIPKVLCLLKGWRVREDCLETFAHIAQVAGFLTHLWAWKWFVIDIHHQFDKTPTIHIVSNSNKLICQIVASETKLGGNKSEVMPMKRWGKARFQVATVYLLPVSSKSFLLHIGDKCLLQHLVTQRSQRIIPLATFLWQSTLSSQLNIDTLASGSNSFKKTIGIPNRACLSQLVPLSSATPLYENLWMDQ